MKRAALIVLILAAFAGQQRVAAQAFPGDWTHKENFTATVTTDKSGSGTWVFQIDLSQSDDATTLFGAMQADGDDIRVTRDEDGTVALDFYLDPSTFDTAAETGTVWVSETESTQLDAGAVSFWVWAGNGSAVSASSGADVFTFFDDFDSIDGWLGDTQDAVGIQLGNATGFANPIVESEAGTWNQDRVFEQSAVVYNPADTGAEYKFYIAGVNDDEVGGSRPRIGLYTSSDALTWSQHASSPIQDGSGDVFGEDPYVVLVGSTYHMYTEHHDGTPGGFTGTIAHYTSANGVTWTFDDEVLSPSAPTAWDDNEVASPTVYYHSVNETFYLLFEGWDLATGTNFQTGLARSADGSTFTKEATNPVATLDVVNEIWDYTSADCTCWIMHGHSVGGVPGRWSTTVADPDGWDSDSFATYAPNVFNNIGNITDIPLDGTRGQVVTHGDGTDVQEWNMLAVMAPGSVWNAQRGTDTTGRDVYANDISLVGGRLKLQPEDVASTRVSSAFTTDSLGTSGFRIVVSRMVEPQSNDSHAYFAIGDTYADTRMLNGYHWAVVQPGVADQSFLRRYSNGAALELDTGIVSEAEHQDWGVHELIYLSDGTLDWLLNGAQIATATNTTHLALDKRFLITQQNTSSARGGITWIEFVGTTEYDGDDPAFTGQGVEETGGGEPTPTPTPPPTPTPTPTAGPSAPAGSGTSALAGLIPLIFVSGGIVLAAISGFYTSRTQGHDMVTGVIVGAVVLIVFLTAVPVVVSLTAAITD